MTTSRPVKRISSRERPIAYLRGMGRERTNPVVDAYFAHRIREYRHAVPAGQKPIAFEAMSDRTRRNSGGYIANSTLANIQNGKVGVGMGVLSNISRFFGMSTQEALAAAEAWASATGFVPQTATGSARAEGAGRALRLVSGWLAASSATGFPSEIVEAAGDTVPPRELAVVTPAIVGAYAHAWTVARGAVAVDVSEATAAPRSAKVDQRVESDDRDDEVALPKTDVKTSDVVHDRVIQPQTPPLAHPKPSVEKKKPKGPKKLH